MKLGEILVHIGIFNFTKFHQNQTKNKKVLLIACFFCSEFQSVSRIMKIIHSVFLTYQVMNEILDGMKVLKLYAWEPSFAKKIGKIRDQEVHTLKLMAYLGAVQTFLFTAAPTIVAVATFATFVLIDENNILTADIAFVSMSYFNLMRQPLNMVSVERSDCDALKS